MTSARAPRTKGLIRHRSSSPRGPRPRPSNTPPRETSSDTLTHRLCRPPGPHPNDKTYNKTVNQVRYKIERVIEVFSPDAFVEGEDDQGCGGDRGDGSGIEGDVLEGLEVLDQGVGPLGGSPH